MQKFVSCQKRPFLPYCHDVRVLFYKWQEEQYYVIHQRKACVKVLNEADHVSCPVKTFIDTFPASNIKRCIPKVRAVVNQHKSNHQLIIVSHGAGFTIERRIFQAISIRTFVKQ